LIPYLYAYYNTEKSTYEIRHSNWNIDGELEQAFFTEEALEICIQKASRLQVTSYMLVFADKEVTIMRGKVQDEDNL
jgi:hypothetical protein